MRSGGIFRANANGLFFNSKFSESKYLARYPDAKHVSKYSRLLPTKLSEYKKVGSLHSRGNTYSSWAIISPTRHQMLLRK